MSGGRGGRGRPRVQNTPVSVSLVSYWLLLPLLPNWVERGRLTGEPRVSSPSLSLVSPPLLAPLPSHIGVLGEPIRFLGDRRNARNAVPTG